MTVSSTFFRPVIAALAVGMSIIALGCGHKEDETPPAPVATGPVTPQAAQVLSDPKMTPQGKAYITEHMSSMQPKNGAGTPK